MQSSMLTVCFQGLSVIPIEVQVQIASGLPAFHIVGLADKAVAESRERVRASLYALGTALPPKRIIINLAPADLQKAGAHYDLPIALALLANMGALPKDVLSEYVGIGELALDGSLVDVSGALSAAVFAASQNKGLICPSAVGSEAAWAGDLTLVAAPHLLDILNHFKGAQVLEAPKPHLEEATSSVLDLQDIKGQASAKRALEVTAAGGHNLLMSGPPGAGKSMLAKRLPSLLPPLSPEEALDVTMIHSISGKLKKGYLLRKRPFRDPHHSASMAALIGGGLRALPGEISLAHHGVLFLDELPEFSRTSLDALRQPLESGEAVIARVNSHITYPARFQLVAAMNPCRCGYFGDGERQCRRVPYCAQDYQARLSGPLLDRIDLQIYVPALSPLQIKTATRGESSVVVAKRVEVARERQRVRFSTLKVGGEQSLNANLHGHLLEQVAQLTEVAEGFLQKAASKWHLSTRGYHKILRVARTIADLEGSEQVEKHHLAEALSYRTLSQEDRGKRQESA